MQTKRHDPAFRVDEKYPKPLRFISADTLIPISAILIVVMAVGFAVDTRSIATSALKGVSDVETKRADIDRRLFDRMNEVDKTMSEMRHQITEDIGSVKAEIRGNSGKLDLLILQFQNKNKNKDN